MHKDSVSKESNSRKHMAGGEGFLSYVHLRNSLFDSIFTSYKSEDFSLRYFGKEATVFNDELFSFENGEEVSINSFDGKKLDAFFVKRNEDHRYVLVFAGYNSDYRTCVNQIKGFADLGYNVLAVSQRSNPFSLNTDITFGYRESFDFLQWVDYLIRYDSDANICAYGYGMGGASIFVSLRNKLPENVKCIITDGCYDSLEMQIGYSLCEKYGNTAGKIATKILSNEFNRRNSISVKELNPSKWLEKNLVPVCFVHGENDYIVPSVCQKVLYNSNKGKKKFYPVKDADHFETFLNDSYFINLNSFISLYL